MIRSAKSSDAPTIAMLLVNAMKELAVQYVRDADPYKAIPIFENFAREPFNQYSYQNMLVYCLEDTVLGIVNAYGGERFIALRAPVERYLKDQMTLSTTAEPETTEGEFYIDALSVSESAQGQGVGKQLIREVINKATAEGYVRIGLLVNETNKAAKTLYEKLDFKIVGNKTILGEQYYHMQFIA